MLSIKSLNREALDNYIRSKEFNEAVFIPITSHRALSHINNPRADADDALLFLAYTNHTLVGYLGVLADWIYTPEGKRLKCGWLSCMWIDPSQRGKGISKKLVRQALAKWNDCILVTEFTPAAKGLYDRLGVFKDLQILPGIRIYRRLDLTKFLPPKHQLFSKSKKLLSLTDRIGNAVLDLRFIFDSPRKPSGVHYFESLNDTHQRYLKTRCTTTLFQKSIHDINWMLKYPWILPGSQPTGESRRYHFSAIDSTFDFKGIHLVNDNEAITGLLVFAIRGTNLKIPFCYFDEDQLQRVVDLIRYLLYHWRISTFTTFQPRLVKALENSRKIALYKKSVRRHFIISKAMEDFDGSQSRLIQDGDADCAFT